MTFLLHIYLQDKHNTFLRYTLILKFLLVLTYTLVLIIWNHWVDNLCWWTKCPEDITNPVVKFFWHKLPFLNNSYIFSIKFWKMFKTPRVVSMYCTGASPRFWIGFTFSNVLVLSASLISLHWVFALVFALQVFWFECCWWEATHQNIHIQHTVISACIDIQVGTYNLLLSIHIG